VTRECAKAGGRYAKGPPGALAAGGARGRAEASRMVAEEVGALAEAQAAAAAAILTGRREKIVAGKVLNAYKKRVGANRRRLSRR
jgi:hypothetical protein